MTTIFPVAYLRELATLINRGSFQGEALVLACAGADNVATCEDMLARAAAKGLIERGVHAPTPQQLFFNVNRDKLLTHYHWITKATTWLDASNIREALS